MTISTGRAQNATEPDTCREKSHGRRAVQLLWVNAERIYASSMIVWCVAAWLMFNISSQTITRYSAFLVKVCTKCYSNGALAITNIRCHKISISKNSLIRHKFFRAETKFRTARYIVAAQQILYGPL